MRRTDKAVEAIIAIRMERILARLESGHEVHPVDMDAAHRIFMARNKRLNLRASSTVTQEDRDEVIDLNPDQLTTELQDNAPPHARLPGGPDE